MAVAKNSKITWTHHTFNPWWGCQRVSPGCEHCYAEAFAKRVGQKVWGPQSPRRFFGDKHWAEPLAWNRAAEKAGERHRVFCSSMADVFEERADLEPHRERLFRLIECTTALDWLLLTKRPKNIERCLPGNWTALGCPGNVWMGTTCEDERRAHERLPYLLMQPAVVHFVSAEPLLEHLDISEYFGEPAAERFGSSVSWVIVGGESGAGHRACDVRAITGVVDRCIARDVPVFVKQDAGPFSGLQGRIPDDVWARKEFPGVRYG